MRMAGKKHETILTVVLPLAYMAVVLFLAAQISIFCPMVGVIFVLVMALSLPFILPAVNNFILRIKVMRQKRLGDYVKK